MSPASAQVAVVDPPALDDELCFDFGEALEDPPLPKPPSWLDEAAGVKAAILRWLEEQV